MSIVFLQLNRFDMDVHQSSKISLTFNMVRTSPFLSKDRPNKLHANASMVIFLTNVCSSYARCMLTCALTGHTVQHVV